MEPLFVYWRLLLLFFLLFLLALKLLSVLWWKPRKMEKQFAKQGITGPPYRFLIGNVKDIVGLMMKASSQPMPFSHNILPRVLSFYHHWKKIYGATFLVWFGPTVRMTVTDPDLIREILASKSKFYEKKEAHPVVRQLEGDGLLSLKGEKWGHHRKIISPTFRIENLKLSIPVISKTVIEMLDTLSAISDGSDSDSVEIEVSEWFQTLTEDVITRMAFGSSYEDGKTICRLQAQQMILAVEAFQKVFIPCYRFLPTKKNLSYWKLDRRIRKSLKKLIDRRREEVISGKKFDFGAKDLLGLMILARENPPLSNGKITIHDIVEECRTFFFAGKQTTSSLLTWTTVLLAMHPTWQLLARDEVLTVCGSRAIPTKDDFAKLKTLTMILNESLRLYPPTIATIRRAKSTVQLGSYTIPVGTELLIPIIAVHHDPELWGPDVNDFNPARFAGGVAHASRHPVAFIPFGIGPRTCIGQNLAILHAKLVLAAILRRFSFTLSPEYRHAPTVLMLLYPQHGAPVVFRRLKTTETSGSDR